MIPKDLWSVLVTFLVLLTADRASCQFKHKYNVLVHCLHGTVEGFTIPSHYAHYDKQRINVFLGIPYAKRITEYSDWRRQFRFNKPEKPSWTGIWDATKYKPACPQLPWLVKQTVPGFDRTRDTSEDCLYMNIFVPNKTDERPVSNPPLYPVMVFIHGGGWTMGASQQYPGMFLAERRVVVVTFNYRLNALGFMSTGDHYSPGNYGLWDQRRALEFVKENIRYFRGDPNMVTIFGQSTGGASVGLHLLSPRTYHMFHQGIMMSGSDRCEWAVIPSIEDAKRYSKELAMELGCPASDHQRLVSCMQLYRTADEIVNASARVRIPQGSTGNPWGPVVDGPFQGGQYAFLPDYPKSMRQQGRFQKLRVMLGQTRDDGSFFIPNMPSLEAGITLTQFTNILREFLDDRDVADKINAMEALSFEYSYWPQRKNATWIRQEVIDMMTDYLFGTGLDETIRAQNLYNKTYSYVFNYQSRYDFMPLWRGIAHGQELQYVFGFPYINETYKEIFGVYPRQEYDMNLSDRNVSEYMISLFTNFSDSGNPTDTKYSVSQFANVSWLEYNIYNHSYLEIGNKSANKANYRQREYSFWREYFVAVSNRDIYEVVTQQTILTVEGFQTATYVLAAVAAILIILVIALLIAICRLRPRDY